MVDLSAIQAQFEALQADNEHLSESLADVKAMMAIDDAGWSLITGIANGERQEGLDLDEVKAVAKQSRVQAASSALPKRAVDLHAGFVFGKGLEIDDTIREPGKRGQQKETVRFFEDPVNQEAVFSGGAHRELQRERFTTGNVVVLCDPKKRKVRRVPIEEITGVMTNPDFAEEVWAWQRTWDQTQADGKSKKMVRWYPTNRWEGAKPTSIKSGTEHIPVEKSIVAVDLRANRQTGWALGVADAVAGLMWSRAYGEVMRYGQIVNESLAKLIFKVTQKTRKGAQNTAVKLGSANEYGGAGVVGEGQDISLVNSSMSAYKFSESQPIAAMAAAAWSVSTMDLLNSSAAAGSSYGSANALTEGNRNFMTGMQNEWTQFLQDIFQACGLGRPGIHWPPLDTPDAYRQAQELALYRPALHDHEFRAEVLDRLDYPGDPNDIPPLLKAESEGSARRPDPHNNGAQAASPDQGGEGNGTGGQNAADKRDLQDN